MFDFLFQNKEKELRSYVDVISIETKKLQISVMAIQKAVGMIAHAIAKSEFIVQRKGGRKKDGVYWMLNVRPNPNETATDFWIDAIQRLLTKGECLICLVSGNMYIIDAYTTDNTVMQPRTYKDITITSNRETFKVYRTFRSDEVMHLRAQNKKIRKYLEQTLELYNSVVSAIAIAKKLASTPKLMLNVPGAMPVIQKKDEQGKIIPMTIDEYKKGIKKLLESDDIEILQNSAGMNLESLKMESSVTGEDIVKIANEIMVECAFAFDIPKAVFLGTITEKADSTNEFITYAVGWVVETINDSMNAKLVGKEAYLKGERIWIDMSKFKHRDIIESAANLDKLRSIGYNFDEIREITGWEALNTEFSQERVITKNYTSELGGDGNEEQETDA